MVIGGRSTISGKGAFAERAYARGETVMTLTGRRLKGAQIDTLLKKGVLRQDDPFEIGRDTYIVLDPLPLLANHSCSPNTGVRGVQTLVALRAIKKGEEITYDYSTVVGNSDAHEEDWHMRCRCKSTLCRKVIGNWRTIPKRRLMYYLLRQVIPSFIQKQIQRA